MPIRDLGYRAYEGARLPPSHNTWVMLRHGMRRAWGSWLVKVAALVSWGPALVWGVAAFVHVGFSAAGAPTEPLDTAKWMHALLKVQLWLLISMVTLGAGSAVIAEDLTHKAFQFYLAKPVTREQYLLGRTAAVAIFCFALLLPSAIMVLLILVGIAPETERLDRAGIALPTILHSVVIALAAATTSVSVSSLSRSRALTMSAWVLVFVVPHMIAMIVDKIAHWPWLYLASLPGLLTVVGDALYRMEPDSALRWYHAAPVLIMITAGSAWLALDRLRRVEIIT